MVDYFKILGVKPQLDIDAAELRKNYYRLSREFHPDFGGDFDENEVQERLINYELINVGYEVLNDKWKRIQHFLELNGALGHPEYEKLPQDFLMEMMEINESLFELQLEVDEVKKQQVLSKIELVKKNLENDFIYFSSSFENQGDKFLAIEKIKEYYLKSKYLLRIQENLSTFAPDSRGIMD